jgi:predicted negative regulator of RcsB-dependent stress response
MHRQKFIPILIIVAGLGAYLNSFRGPFIFDDLASIRESPNVRHLWPIWEAMSAPRISSVDGRPIVCLTLALNYALGGLNVWGYHAFNLAVHLLNGLLLYSIVRRTLGNQSLHDRYAQHADWIGFAIALIWLVHPLQTESVTYIVQRQESLMGMFLLLTLYCVIRGTQSANRRNWYVAAVVACALGMGSKEVMVVAPLIVLLYDRVFLTSSFRELWQKRRGLYTGLAATWLILAWLVATTPHPMTGFGLSTLNTWDYLKTEAGVIVYYLRLCFWPHPLVIDHYDWPIARSLEDVLVPGSIVVVLLGATLWAFCRRPMLGFVGAWFFLILAPTSSILPSAGEVAAERRMYLPLAAVVTLVVLGFHQLLRNIVPDRKEGPLTRRNLDVALLIAITLTLVALTIRRNDDFRTELSIWTDAVSKRPNNARAHLNLGDALMAQGRLEEATAHYAEALRLSPNYGTVHIAIGVALGRLGRLDEAMEHFSQAIALGQELATAYFNLGVALAQKGRFEEASKNFEAALRVDPDSRMAKGALNALRSRMSGGDSPRQSPANP